LAALENKHKVIDEKDRKKPGLRRGSPSEKNDSDDTGGDGGGRPQLNRRKNEDH
jgi:hypothetical protein